MTLSAKAGPAVFNDLAPTFRPGDSFTTQRTTKEAGNSERRILGLPRLVKATVKGVSDWRNRVMASVKSFF
jgi:hypothetical protein